MLNKKVIIQADFILVGRKKIMWNEIAGVKEYNDAILQKLSDRFPQAELFLRNGKVVTISNLNFFQHTDNKPEDLAEIDYATSIKIIRMNVKNLNPVFNSWISWRVVLPCAFAEIIITGICVLLKYSFHSTVEIALLAAIFTVPFGLAWERNARRKNAIV